MVIVGGTDEIDVSFPVEETDAVVTLVTSVIAEARRVGVLRARYRR